MKASLSTVRLESLNQTQVSYEANSMFDDLMSKAKSLACFCKLMAQNWHKKPPKTISNSGRIRFLTVCFSQLRNFIIMCTFS